MPAFCASRASSDGGGAGLATREPGLRPTGNLPPSAFILSGRHRTIWPKPGGVGREREPVTPVGRQR
jgi:hypothetical protein